MSLCVNWATHTLIQGTGKPRLYTYHVSLVFKDSNVSTYISAPITDLNESSNENSLYFWEVLLHKDGINFLICLYYPYITHKCHNHDAAFLVCLYGISCMHVCTIFPWGGKPGGRHLWLHGCTHMTEEWQDHNAALFTAINRCSVDSAMIKQWIKGAAIWPVATCICMDIDGLSGLSNKHIDTVPLWYLHSSVCLIGVLP